ncbi:MAG: hypothetical protein KDD19_18430 [Phaeodactylibacter sp.]|nr:hypothetical protein [Phaeodactylibacter sp.]MCB9049576.1 hypothetical protein [Lewinellaceae bacterium]
MRHTLLYTLLMASLLAVPARWAKAQEETREALLHINKPFYVTGEVIWYQLYLPATLKGQLFTLKATLLDEQGQAADVSFISSKGLPFCQGYYFIPYNLPSGMYRLWFTATTEGGALHTLAMGAVPIYNDLQPLPKDIPASEVAATPTQPAGVLAVRIEMESALPLRPRQPLRLRVWVQGQSGEPVDAWGSLSIRDEQLCGKKVMAGATLFSGLPIAAAQRYRSGINWPGSVVDEEGAPLKTPLLGVIGVDDGRLLFTKADKEGKFLLTLPEYSGQQRWQFIDHAAPGLKVQWEHPTPPAPAPPLAYTQGILDYLSYSRQRKKIYQLYAAQETPLASTDADQMNALPGWEPTFSYIVPNYERFPDMATFFQEVVPMVRFPERRNGFAVTLYNPASQDYFSAPPLFIIDGKATRDASFVAALNPAYVEQVDLLTSPSQLRAYYPAIGAGGVIRIRTNLPSLILPEDQEDDIFSLPGMQPVAGFPAQDKDLNLPALRPAVLWLPALQVQSEDGATVSLLHSDDYGEFCIEVVVQSEDGRRGSGRYCYSVER